MTGDAVPGSLVRRAAAFALDYAWIAAWLILVVALGILLGLVAPGLQDALFGNPITGQLTGFLLITLPVALVFVLSEASPAGATPGKRRMGLRVVTGHGDRLSLGRSIARTGLKFLPWELTHAVIWRFSAPGVPDAVLTAGLALVWVLVGANLASALIDGGRRTLYDRLTRTRVVAA
jgi:uncharacterized RDD family membrane protein YckC